MKIECDKCGAKYSIADDKVRGKTFKIRCKKCSNVIIVRDKAGGGDAADSDPPADEPGWHLAIGGETVGPLSEAEVRDRYAAGEIDKETSVWQEGFEDWLPLGDVQTFSDLPDRAAAAAIPAAPAPDPFASSGEDDYGGRSAAREPEPAPARVSPSPAVAASPSLSAKPSNAGGGGGGGGGGESPRVNALTGARNENSVLFSLDSLSSAVMSGKPGGGGGGGGGGGMSSFSSSSPSSSSHTPSATGNSEGSGLIDIRSMGAMLGGGGGGGGGGEDDRDDSMLPSFGGTGFGGLSAAPLLTAAPSTAAPEPVVMEPQRSSQAPLYIIIGILILAMGGLGIFVATREPPPPPQPQIVYQAAPVQPDRDKDDDDDDKKKKAKDEDGGDEAAAEAGDTKATDDKGGTGSKTPGKKGDKKTTAVKPGDKKDAKTDPGGGGADTAKPEVKKAPAEDATPSVECILDPSKCKKSGGGGGGGGGGSKPPPDSSLPEKLELEDIKAGSSAAKSAAESNCKKFAKGGEKVKIKLSISGPTGNVISSSPADDAGNAQLASCVASELKKSSFKKVQKEQIGTQISVSF